MFNMGSGSNRATDPKGAVETSEETATGSPVDEPVNTKTKERNRNI